MHTLINQLAVIIGHSYAVTLHLTVQLITVLFIGTVGSTVMAIIHVKMHNETFWRKSVLILIFQAWLITLGIAVFCYVCFELFNHNQ